MLCGRFSHHNVKIYLLISILCVLCIRILSNASNFSATELVSLHDLYLSTNGTGWTYQEGDVHWDFSQVNPNPCTEKWGGITCSANCINCHVQEIDLGLYNLYGTIPSSIGNFSQLTQLGLSLNTLYGTIPPTIGMLHNLTVLHLDSNLIGGTLPSTISSLHNLAYMNIAFNTFEGSIPQNITNLIKLKQIYISWNRFTGSIDFITHLPMLQVFAASSNHFATTIPSEITHLTSLVGFAISSNSFHGTIPPSFGDCKHLFAIDLSKNALSGSIPSTLTQFPQLYYLDFSYNKLNGSLPRHFLANCTTLFYLFLQYNHFTSSLPTSICSSPLLYFAASYNSFTGTLPDTIQLWNKTLTNFFISNNKFHGTFPEALTKLSRCDYLDISNNLFTGSLPASFGNMINIQGVILRNNMFYGALPSTIQNLPKLGTLSIGWNAFTGTLDVLNNPTIFTFLFKFWIQNNLFTGTFFQNANLTMITDVNISSNLLTGPMSNSVIYMKQLSSLDVSDNFLTGTMQNTLFEKPFVTVFNIARNSFTGNLEQRNCIGNFTNVDVSDNSFTGTIPLVYFQSKRLVTFAAVKNCLSGSIPVELICANPSLVTLALDGLHTQDSCQHRFFPGSPTFTSYKLEYQLPGSLSTLRCLFHMAALESLHLSGNAITGSIPSDLLLTNSLTDLSLSHNQLTGSIPLIIQEYSQWKNLDLSFNKFNGMLSTNFTTPSTNTSIKLINNRLSGSIPSHLFSAEDIDILQGNLFDCDGDSTFRSSSHVRDVPSKDEYANVYTCGSDDINTALYVWIIMMCILGMLLWVVIYSARSPTHCQWLGSSLLPRVQEWLDTKVASMPLEKDHPLWQFLKSMKVIRTAALIVTGYALCILLPAYGGLSASYSTHSDVYAWTVSSGYLTGFTPAMILLCLVTILIVIVSSDVNLLLLKYYEIDTPHLSVFSRQLESNSWSMNSFQKWFSAPRNAWIHNVASTDHVVLWRRSFIVCINCSIVLLVNVLYVYVTTLKLSTATLGVVTVLLSLFKLCWSNFVILGIFVKYLNHSYEQYEKKLRNIISDINFLAYLTIFNNIVAPCLADILVDPNCFYYMINSPPDITVSFLSTSCDVYSYDLKMNIFCSSYQLDSHSTSYNPPYIYSFQCTSALLNTFATVFVYKYIISCIVRVVTNILYPDGFYWGRAWNEFQEHWKQRMFPRRNDFLSTERDLSKESSSNSNRKMEATALPHSSKVEVLSVRENVINRETFVVTLIGDFAVMLTFGIAFPPLGLVVCCSILLNTWLHQWKIIRCFQQLAQPNTTSHREVSTDTISSMKVMMDELQIECSDLTVLLWPVIPLLSIMSAGYLSFFLFDTLGDKVGPVNAIWILFFMALMPVIVWMIQNISVMLFRCFMIKREQKPKELSMRTMIAPENTMERVHGKVEKHIEEGIEETISPLALSAI